MRRRLRRLPLSRPRRGLSFPGRPSVESPARLLRGFLRLKVASKRATKRREARRLPHSPPVGVYSFGPPPDVGVFRRRASRLVASHPRPPALGVKYSQPEWGTTSLMRSAEKTPEKRKTSEPLSPLVTRQRLPQAPAFVQPRTGGPKRRGDGETGRPGEIGRNWGVCRPRRPPPPHPVSPSPRPPVFPSPP